MSVYKQAGPGVAGRMIAGVCSSRQGKEESLVRAGLVLGGVRAASCDDQSRSSQKGTLLYLEDGLVRASRVACDRQWIATLRRGLWELEETLGTV
jgi:hypothetical protein